jgi:cell division ATPase FtsA
MDIASLLDLPMTEAEHLKLAEGSIARSALDEKPTALQEILEARAGQYLHLMEFRIEELAGQLPPPGGLILTGGGACLPGLCDYAEELLQCPVRLGQVVGVADWPLELSAPGWAVAAGLALHGGIANGW